MKHIQLVVKGELDQIENRGCGECQASCQSACKTSCTVSNQECVNKTTSRRR
ncbi:MAG: six-cysteine ranthipeptide SCIFF [Firmicutes bacterium]|nr:six-cysteine ranthipeptide SCIFF [Candidatus Fermentithermobacillaceae bacterium]